MSLAANVILTTGQRSISHLWETLGQSVDATTIENVPNTGANADAYIDAWRTALNNATSRNAPLAAVYEDDAVPFPGFTAQYPAVLEALLRAPPRAASLYLSRTPKTRDPWQPLWEWRACIAIILPVDWIEPMLEAPRHPRAPTHADMNLLHFLHQRGEKLWHTNPSLIEHGAPSASLLGHSNRLRVAKNPPGPDHPYPTDWTMP